MKTIGLLGGMSWESTALYYSGINLGVREALGGLNSAKLLISSINFAEIVAVQKTGNWDEMARMLATEAAKLEQAGAQAIVITTNTMHKLAPQIQAAITIPIISIIDVTAAAIQAKGLKKVILLGTSATMEDGFYQTRLHDFGIEAITPCDKGRERVNNTIYEELCQGIVCPDSKAAYLEAITALVENEGAEGVILGCTEIPLLIGQSDVDIPLFDTTQIHLNAALDFVLERA